MHYRRWWLCSARLVQVLIDSGDDMRSLIAVVLVTMSMFAINLIWALVYRNYPSSRQDDGLSGQPRDQI